MNKTSTPIIYQLIQLGNNSKVDFLDINLLYKEEEWLTNKFKEFENNLTDIPDNVIDKILTRAKVC